MTRLFNQRLSMLSLSGVLGLLLTLGAGAAHAEWVRVTGRALIYGGDYQQARKTAQEDALRQAALMFGAEVSSTDQMELGRLTQSSVSVSSRAKAKRVVPVSEEVEDDTLVLTVDADMYEQPLCDGASVNAYRRKLALLSFSLQDPRQASVGGLYGVERDIPSYLNQLLQSSPRLAVHEASQLHLYDELANAPTHETEQRTLTKAVSASRDLGVQFVVSGVVRNITLRDPEGLKRSVLNNTLRFVGLKDTYRVFDVEMFIHDGFSGAILFQKRYRTGADWEARADEHYGLLSAGFNEMEYGRAVKRALMSMAGDIEENVSCQPFMTRISRVEGRQIMFEAGANAGIRPGDTFQVYRSRQLFDATRFQGTELRDVKLALQVDQVQPEFSIGRLNIDPTRLNIQMDDVLIRW
ncbi:flagellar assembly protein FlgT [Hahella sp. CR1]|uniref:flagellar assembly protein FlgT n=1 Tax=Hahella sp. CR1 TaxID=2992807 RepID=UPI00244122DF|nr:flagellar assembly protein FlgT [Hahella sp. CR1]MDG9671407.1 flagellar assembly protein FlgT [Hahella sp. CR1]